MPKETTLPEHRPSQSRWVQDSTLGAGAVLILALFVMVNNLAIRHYQRFDWTSEKIYSLSGKSLNIVEGIAEDIDLVIFISPDSPIYGPVNELLSSYAAANPKLKKREVDPGKNLIEAQRLVQKYSIERDNVVIIASAGDRRVIEEYDLAEYDYSGAQMGQPPTIGEFKGEQLITSALLALVEARKPKVLFTTGHGEAALEPVFAGGAGEARSLSRAKDLLGGDNFEIEEWGSLGKSEVPADTDLVVIAGPTTNFLPPELAGLSSYLDAGGRLLLMIDPVFSPRETTVTSDQAATGLVDLGLNEWLAGYGIEIRDDVVVDPAGQLPFYGPETIFTDGYGSHPVVEALAQRRTRVLLPLARSVSVSGAPSGFEVTELVRTSESGWGETDLTAEEEAAPGDEDTAGPVSLAVAVSFEVADDSVADAPADESSAEAPGAAGEGELPEEVEEIGDDGPDDDVADEGVAEDREPPEARMVVFGDLDFASDAWVGNYDNAVLLLNALNWLVKREELIDIEARKPEKTSFTLSQGELSQVYLLVLVILPGLAIAFGIWIYMRRRR